MALTGMLSLKSGERCFTLHFLDQGWLCADMVQYLDEILEAADRETSILKLLGITMSITKDLPPRKAHHWVFVDLDTLVLETNSELLRRAVDQEPPPPDSPWSQHAMERIHRMLDTRDFTVKLFT